MSRPEEAQKSMDALLEVAAKALMTAASALITAMAQTEAVASVSTVTRKAIFSEAYDALEDVREYMDYFKQEAKGYKHGNSDS